MTEVSNVPVVRKGRFRTLVTGALIFCGIVVAIVLFTPTQENNTPPAEAALDYSKPVFTTCCTIICPEILMFARDADHSPEKIGEMFNSFWGRSEKAKELGCVELQEGTPVYASKFEDEFASVHLSQNASDGFFTPQNELTNAVPGQSPSTAAELATAHISSGVSVPIPVPDNNSPGSLLVGMPAREAIPIGNVVAARDVIGSGAMICPDPNTLIALLNATWNDAQSHPDSDENSKQGNQKWETLKKYGCSYVPPDTPMASEGGNPVGSLAFVTVSLPDGRTIKGVTFPNEIRQAQQALETKHEVPIPVPQGDQENAITQEEKQRRYDALMQPEEARHAAAIQQEENRHSAAVAAIKAEENSLDVTKMHGDEPTQAGLRLQAEFNGESEKHTTAVEQEEQRYAAAQAKAKDLAARPEQQ